MNKKEREELLRMIITMQKYMTGMQQQLQSALNKVQFMKTEERPDSSDDDAVEEKPKNELSTK